MIVAVIETSCEQQRQMSAVTANIVSCIAFVCGVGVMRCVSSLHSIFLDGCVDLADDDEVEANCVTKPVTVTALEAKHVSPK